MSFKKIPLTALLVGLALGILIKTFALDILRISGESMEPTFSDGDIVLVNKLAYGLVKPDNKNFFIQWSSPKENDCVIYLHENKIVIKRCVATEKTHLEFFSDSNYTMCVGEKKIPLTEMQFASLSPSREVPASYIFALGDNLDSSIDSRHYGFVSTKNIVARILFQ